MLRRRIMVSISKNNNDDKEQFQCPYSMSGSGLITLYVLSHIIFIET